VFQINNDTTDIFHQFAEPEIINTFQPTILGPKDTETDYTVLSNTQFIPNPNAKSNMPVFIWVGAIIIIGLIISYFVSNSKTGQTNYLSDFDQNQTVVLPAETATPTSNNSAIEDSAVTNTNMNSYFELIDDNGYTPEPLVRSFFYDLENQRLQDAFNRTYVAQWEQNGYDWFSSISEFGGITSIELKSVTKNGESTNKVSFAVEFKQSHTYNGTQCFSQIITLSHRKFFDEKNIWMITGVKNSIDPYTCD
jgi:hypothetical protein